MNSLTFRRFTVDSSGVATVNVYTLTTDRAGRVYLTIL